LLREDPKLPGVRIRELLEPLGCSASKTVVDDYLRQVTVGDAKAKGDRSIQKLIDRGLDGASVTVVLIGAETYRRKWCL
jgi:hypothetical protein